MDLDWDSRLIEFFTSVALRKIIPNLEIKKEYITFFQWSTEAMVNKNTQGPDNNSGVDTGIWNAIYYLIKAYVVWS